MKKIAINALAVLMAMPAFAGAKDYRKKVREYKRAGWEIYGSSQTMESAFRLHCEALGKEGVYEVTGEASGVKSLSVGRQVASNNACINYVQQVGRFLRGRVASDFHADGESEDEFNHFYAAYETLLQKEIDGELRPSFTLVRTGKDGRYEMMSFFLVDEDSASKARIKALETAARESRLAQDIADSVRESIDKGFVPEETSAE